jgi:molybdenum cofactor biosynthesis enzyme MoaA
MKFDHKVKLLLNTVVGKDTYKDQLPEVVDWLEDRDLHYLEHWNYTTPDYFKDDWSYTFSFKNSKDAVMFALRWS